MPDETQAVTRLKALFRKHLESDEIDTILRETNCVGTPSEYWVIASAFQQISDEYAELAVK